MSFEELVFGLGFPSNLSGLDLKEGEPLTGLMDAPGKSVEVERRLKGWAGSAASLSQHCHF